MRLRAAILSLSLLIAAAASSAIRAATPETAAATPPPTLAPGQATPIAAPYDTSADAHAQVDAAFAAAKASGRKVMIDFGGNWCPDCRMLAGVLAESQVRQWADAHFVTVMVDIGRRNKNLDIAQKYGVKIEGVPAVGVVTADGRLVNAGKVDALADARSWSQQAVVDLLAKWEKS